MEQNLELQKRLDAYQIDDPKSSFPFSSKLAKEQNWTPAFTQRAIREYKRFCFLAVAAGHPVSPSEIVDEVWHLHLTYSHEYWNHFCPKVLEMPFHHFPSTGGSVETEKFEDWRQRTVDSYRKFFGEEPPRDIWIDRPRFIGSEEHYRISKSSVKKTLLGIGGVAAAVILTGCAAQMNPFELRGPEFLGFYSVLSLGVIIATVVCRNEVRKLPVQPMNRGLTAPELALLSKGKVNALNTMVAKWTVLGVVEFEPKSATLITRNPSYQPEDQLESRVFDLLRGRDSIKLSTLRYQATNEFDQLESELERKGLLLDANRIRLAKSIPIIASLILLPVGAYKFFIGLDRGKPVGFLVLMWIAIIFFLILNSVKTSRRSKQGDFLLAQATANKQHLKNLYLSDPNHVPDNYGYAYALFGSAAFATTIYSVPMNRMQPKQGQSSCGGSSCGSFSSGCGGSGDGGGGGGDGGGCGGGCGGCGG